MRDIIWVEKINNKKYWGKVLEAGKHVKRVEKEAREK